MEWGLGGLPVAAFLGLMLIGLDLAGVRPGTLWQDLVRTALFLLVALLIGWLRQRLDRRGRELSRARDSSHSLLEHSSQGILVHRDGQVVFVNARLRRMIGWDEAGAPADEAETRANEAPANEARAALLSLAPDTEMPGELCLRKPDGTSLWVEATASRVQFDGATAVQISVTDVTARRESEEKRRELAELARRQEEQLEHSTRLAELGEMAAAISHELNQPLTGIRNYARNAFYMLEKKAGGEEEVKGNLRLISEQVDRAAKIINQMRELTRRSDSVFAPVELNGVVRESVEFLLPQMRLSEVEVSLSLAEDLPAVNGDRIRLAQVLLNLLSNARQAMDGSTVRRLSIATRRETVGDRPVVLEVKDTGKGFTEEQGRRLFQPFYTTRKGGHGLGLSISRAIIQDHKGSIEAAGTPGGGATFTVRLPGRDGRREP